MIGVRRGLRRGKSLWLNTLLLHNLHTLCYCRLGCGCSKGGKEITLTSHRLTLLGGRLGLRHLGELTLRCLLRHARLLGRCKVLHIAQERGKIELGIEGSQLVNIGRADLKILRRKLHGHIGADRGQTLREQ